jgi:hypothetical protein
MEKGTTIVFGLPGVAVERVGRVTGEHGEPVRLVHVRTAELTAAGCPVCGVISTSVKQYRTTRPRDLPYGEEPLAVRWHKRQHRYRERACPRKAFIESIGEIPPRRRAGAAACGHRRRPLPPGSAREPGRHQGAAAGHSPGARPPRHHQGPGLGQPAPAAARPRAAHP